MGWGCVLEAQHLMIMFKSVQCITLGVQMVMALHCHGIKASIHLVHLSSLFNNHYVSKSEFFLSLLFFTCSISTTINPGLSGICLH